jgi:arginyl-tRNA synthetase
VLLFPDYLGKVRVAVKSVLPQITDNDIIVDESGFSDIVIRTFAASKKTGADFAAVASQVQPLISKLEFVDRIEARNGYINVFLKSSVLIVPVLESLERTGTYPDNFQDPERVCVEHTSTNPTGPIHIGRARNSIIGDSVARILSRYGYRVTTQYYVNDAGKQVIALHEGFRRYFEGKDRNVSNLLAGYQKIYQEMESLGGESKILGPVIKRYESNDEELIESVKSAAAIVLKSIKESLERVGIRIDDFVWESGFLHGTDLDHVFEGLEEHLKDENGAKYLDLPNGRKLFLQRSDGTSLYPARDLAYHLFKALNADWLIDVLGEDHKDHGTAIRYVLMTLLDFKQRLDFIFYGFVSLDSGKLSTRKGNIITLDELVERTTAETHSIVAEKRKDLEPERLKTIAEAVAVSSIRFSIAKVNADKHMIFRWSEALNFEGDSAPFIMYAYSRATTLFKDYGTGSWPAGEVDLVQHERKLARTVFLYPYYLTDAAKSLRPDVICSYLLSLVKAYNDFYSTCRIKGENQEVQARRLSLNRAFRSVIFDAASLVGIRLLEEM